MNKTKAQFFPEIEALRAIAVIMTLLAHFIPKNSPEYIPYLWFGVDLFFTISGFLITFILLKNIYANEAKPASTIIKHFFIRRVLRLFPAYYAFILFFFLLRNVFSIYIWTNDYNFYFFTYLQNMYYFFQGELNSVFSHLWSLGVEEQFYMCWPFLIVFLGRNRYVILFASLIVLSITLNFFFQNSIGAFRVLVFANLHTLGAGALLAYLYYFKEQSKGFDWLSAFRMPLFIFSFISLLIFINIKILPVNLRILFMEVALMSTTFFAVLLSVKGWPSYLRFIFQNHGMHHIGKISYGIYLYHMPLIVSISVVISKIPALGFLLPANLWVRVITLMLYSYTIALGSYYLYEVHFLKLKAKFS